MGRGGGAETSPVHPTIEPTGTTYRTHDIINVYKKVLMLSKGKTFQSGPTAELWSGIFGPSHVIPHIFNIPFMSVLSS